MLQWYLRIRVKRKIIGNFKKFKIAENLEILRSFINTAIKFNKFIKFINPIIFNISQI